MSESQFLFLGFISTNKVLRIKEDCISTVLNGRESESVRELQSFLWFANLYRRFVKEYSSIEYSTKEMIKKVK